MSNKSRTFVIIGRRPYGENTVGVIIARDLYRAKQNFTQQIWAGEEEARKDRKSSEGTDTYFDFIVEIEGKYRILRDDWGERKASQVKWDKT